jgi:serine/threonine protein kinase
MHMNKPPYAHNDMKPGNVLLSLQPNNKPPQAVIMDFGSASIAQKQIRSHSEALALQVHTHYSYVNVMLDLRKLQDPQLSPNLPTL